MQTVSGHRWATHKERHGRSFSNSRGSIAVHDFQSIQVLLPSFGHSANQLLGDVTRGFIIATDLEFEGCSGAGYAVNAELFVRFAILVWQCTFIDTHNEHVLPF